MTTNTRPYHIFVFVITMLLVFIMAARAPVDSDMWWHLRAGQETWLQHSPYTIDTLSYTKAGERWISHSWLFELLLYMSFHIFGYTGISALVACAATLTMGILFMQMGEPVLFRSFIVILGSIVASFIWSPRPQAIALVLFALTLFILDIYKRQKINLTGWLAPIFLIWGNLYGGYSLGFMAAGLIIAGEGINRLLNIKEKPVLSWLQIRNLVFISMICGAVILFNPHGFKILTIPFETVNIKTIHLIDEWSKPNLLDIRQAPFYLFTVLLVISLILNRKQADATDILFSVWFLAMAFYAKKYFGPAAVALTPILSRNLWAVIQTRLATRKVVRKTDRTMKMANINHKDTTSINRLIIILLAITALIKLFYVSYLPNVNIYIDQLYPKAGVEWLLENQPEPNIFNEYEWGGYMAWNLPIYPLYIDARTDLFGDEIITEWLSILYAEEGWEDKVSRWDIKIIFVRHDRPIVKAALDQGWKQVFIDSHSIILLPNK